MTTLEYVLIGALSLTVTLLAFALHDASKYRDRYWRAKRVLRHLTGHDEDV